VIFQKKERGEALENSRTENLRVYTKEEGNAFCLEGVVAVETYKARRRLLLLRCERVEIR